MTTSMGTSPWEYQYGVPDSFLLIETVGSAKQDKHKEGNRDHREASQRLTFVAFETMRHRSNKVVF